MRIGVILNYNPRANTGGGYSYIQRLIYNLKKIQNIELYYIVFNSNVTQSKDFNYIYINNNKSISLLIFKIIIKFLNLLNIKIFNKFYYKLLYKSHEKIFKQHNIKILYYPTPSLNNYNFPYISTYWDIGHKSTYSFPELVLNNEFEKRDTFFKSTYQKSFAIFCESNTGKNELVNYEGINPDRIYLLSMFPGSIIDETLDEENQNKILVTHNLEKNKFFFYPAQFWSHKNHYTLVKAFSSFKKVYPNFKLVLTGSDKGNLIYIKKVIHSLGIEKDIILLDFVCNKYLYTFYINTAALVFPSLLGPTNMPLLEAQYLNVKIICSNLIGHMEQLENHALFFNPLDYKDICIKMLEILDYEIDHSLVKKINFNEQFCNNMLHIKQLINLFDI